MIDNDELEKHLSDQGPEMEKKTMTATGAPGWLIVQRPDSKQRE